MRLTQIVALVACCAALAQGASVVRVPRVYNILIKSDGALAPSEAVSVDAMKGSAEEGAAAQDDRAADDASAEEGDDSEADEPGEQLPVLNAKDGAVQDGVNYTQVPLSRAYPLTRYTAPIIAAHYPFPYLHGGLILGPVPKLASPQKQAPAEPQVPAEVLQRAAVDMEEPQAFQRPEELLRPIQQLPLPQYRTQAEQLREPSAFRERSYTLPQGAYEDDDSESVRVEALEGEEEEGQLA